MSKDFIRLQESQYGDTLFVNINHNGPGFVQNNSRNIPKI